MSFPCFHSDTRNPKQGTCYITRATCLASDATWFLFTITLLLLFALLPLFLGHQNGFTRGRNCFAGSKLNLFAFLGGGQKSGGFPKLFLHFGSLKCRHVVALPPCFPFGIYWLTISIALCIYKYWTGGLALLRMLSLIVCTSLKP